MERLHPVTERAACDTEGMTRAAKGGAETDVFSRYWRRHMCWTQRAGACKAVKRRANRRERREGKLETREALNP